MEEEEQRIEEEERRIEEDRLRTIMGVYGLERLLISTVEELELSIDLLKDMRDIVEAKQPANRNVEYWAGMVNPATGASECYRNGADKSAITDPDIIKDEEEIRLQIEAADKAASPTAEEHASRLHSFGIQVDFLLLLTFKLDIWDWTTAEVVQYLVKPLTERYGRCRFAELPALESFFGPATVFASHCKSITVSSLYHHCTITVSLH